MPRFEILHESALVGWSELELGDPQMGVAFGRFIPAPGYAVIQDQVIAAMTRKSASPQLSARLVDGPTLESTGGVHIADCSPEVGAEGLEVSVLGILYPTYETLFLSELVRTRAS